jgi:formylglycine-generating enzyme required for sulfatase activity
VTEDGAYDMAGDLLKHSKDAKFWIPTEKEWCKAAYYDPEKSRVSGKPFHYDFGDKTSYKPDGYPKAEPPPGSAHSANYNKKLKSTTVVGAYSDALSPYGLFDMNGNVFEWTETQRGENAKNIRGGAWNYGGNYVLFSTRTGARLKEGTAGYGFRLAAKAE